MSVAEEGTTKGLGSFVDDKSDLETRRLLSPGKRYSIFVLSEKKKLSSLWV